MKNQQIAVLITCHSRKIKTLTCLASLFNATLPAGYDIDVYLTDDGSTDGTSEAVKAQYPSVKIIKGNGSLFWAGGMRLAWESAMDNKSYDAYLLINDDVKLKADFMSILIRTQEYSIEKTGKTGIYSGPTVDEDTGEITYGGYKIKVNHIMVKLQILSPLEFPQECEITNANVLWISKSVIDKIGIFDYRFTHGIADYDYSLRAHKKGVPVFLAPDICGVCTNDHPINWKNSDVALKDRIAYLKSPKGLAYSEYLYYIKRHFPMFLPYSFLMLWMKTFFPVFWEKFKR